MGHACEFETSMMLALRPEDLVRRDEIKDDPPKEDPVLRARLSGRGYVPAHRPRRRRLSGAGDRREKGQAFLNAAIDRTAEVVQRLIQRAMAPR